MRNALPSLGVLASLTLPLSLLVFGWFICRKCARSNNDNKTQVFVSCCCWFQFLFANYRRCSHYSLCLLTAVNKQIADVFLLSFVVAFVIVVWQICTDYAKQLATGSSRAKRLVIEISTTSPLTSASLLSSLSLTTLHLAHPKQQVFKNFPPLCSLTKWLTNWGQ